VNDGGVALIDRSISTLSNGVSTLVSGRRTDGSRPAGAAARFTVGMMDRTSPCVIRDVSHDIKAAAASAGRRACSVTRMVTSQPAAPRGVTRCQMTCRPRCWPTEVKSNSSLDTRSTGWRPARPARRIAVAVARRSISR